MVRAVAANALVSLWGNRYSVPPGLVGGHVQVRWRLGTDTITMSSNRAAVAEHRLAPRGAQRTVRLPEHTAALERVAAADSGLIHIKAFDLPKQEKKLVIDTSGIVQLGELIATRYLTQE